MPRMKYRDNMPEEELAILIAEIEAMDEAYADIHQVFTSEEELEWWAEKEIRAWLP